MFKDGFVFLPADIGKKENIVINKKIVHFSIRQLQHLSYSFFNEGKYNFRAAFCQLLSGVLLHGKSGKMLESVQCL